MFSCASLGRRLLSALLCALSLQGLVFVAADSGKRLLPTPPSAAVVLAASLLFWESGGEAAALAGEGDEAEDAAKASRALSSKAMRRVLASAVRELPSEAVNGEGLSRENSNSETDSLLESEAGEGDAFLPSASRQHKAPQTHDAALSSAESQERRQAAASSHTPEAQAAPSSLQKTQEADAGDAARLEVEVERAVSSDLLRPPAESEAFFSDAKLRVPSPEGGGEEEPQQGLRRVQEESRSLKNKPQPSSSSEDREEAWWPPWGGGALSVRKPTQQQQQTRPPPPSEVESQLVCLQWNISNAALSLLLLYACTSTLISKPASPVESVVEELPLNSLAQAVGSLSHGANGAAGKSSSLVSGEALLRLSAAASYARPPAACCEAPGEALANEARSNAAFSAAAQSSGLFRVKKALCRGGQLLQGSSGFLHTVKCTYTAAPSPSVFAWLLGTFSMVTSFLDPLLSLVGNCLSALYDVSALAL